MVSGRQSMVAGGACVLARGCSIASDVMRSAGEKTNTKISFPLPGACCSSVCRRANPLLHLSTKKKSKKQHKFCQKGKNIFFMPT